VLVTMTISVAMTVCVDRNRDDRLPVSLAAFTRIRYVDFGRGAERGELRTSGSLRLRVCCGD